MPNILALCDSCGAVFPSGIRMSNARHVTLAGNRIQCPRCGAMARIPDGVFNAVGDTLELLSGPRRTYRDLDRIAAVLEQARSGRLSPQEAADLVRQEVPELQKLADILPKTRVELYAFIGLVLTAIAIVVSQRAPDDDRDDAVQNVNIEQTINQSITQTWVGGTTDDPEKPKESAEVKPGNNK